jgi:hypothetical protein
MAPKQLHKRITWPFWTAVILTMPVFGALVVCISGTVTPNPFVYLLVLLIPLAAVGLTLAFVTALTTRRIVSGHLLRLSWIVLGFAVVAGLAIVLIWR